MAVEVEKKYNQSVFVCSVPGSTLPRNHFVFTVKEVIEDFKREFPGMFEYEYAGCGRPKKYFEEELLGLVIYGGYNNKNSCRELSDWCLNNDESVMFIMNNKFPSKSVIQRFISDNGLLLDAFFAYTVSYGVDKSLIDGDCVAVDGTYFKAYANNFRLIKIEEIEFLEDLIKTHGGNFSKNSIWFKLHKYYLKNSNKEENDDLIDEINSICNKEAIKLLKIALMSLEKQDYILCLLNHLKSNYDGKHTISLTDPDSRWIMDKDGKTGLNYNYQVATDTKNGMIVAQYLTQKPTDHHELLPMAYEIINNLEFKPNVIIADNAYIQNTTLEFLHNNSILPIMPDRVQSTHSQAEFAKAQFEYDFDKDVYICPKGEILTRKNDRYQKDKLYKVYSTKKCKTCIYHDKCTKSRVREILEDAHPLRLKLRKDYLTPEGRKYYKKRANNGEGPFATIKTKQKKRSLQRRGLQNAQKELTLQSIIHNLKKIHNNKN